MNLRWRVTAAAFVLFLAAGAAQYGLATWLGSATTFSQLSALAVIEMYGPILLGDLAARERVQPPTVTRLVANLEGRGLVVRAGDPLDKRMFRVAITTAGERVLAKSRERRTAFLATTLRTLDPADRDALRQAIPILEQIAEA